MISLSFLLLLSFSACHAVVKRKAPDGKLYVFSKRHGCVSVESKETCPAFYPLTPYLAKVYKQTSQGVTTEMKQLDAFGLNDKCIQAIKTVLCSQVVPRCSSEDGSRDYGDASKLCQTMLDSCPQVAQKLRSKNFCGNHVKSGKNPVSQCVAPSTPTRGICPQPKFKMDKDFLADYNGRSERGIKVYEYLQNVKDGLNRKVFSSKCLSQLKLIHCTPLYCSADENMLLIEYTKNDCNNILKTCIDNILSENRINFGARNFMEVYRKTLQGYCDTYPGTVNTTLLVEPPTVAVPSAANILYYGPNILLLLAVHFVVKIYI